MKAVHFSKKDTHLVDLETKKILKYPTPTSQFDVGKMIVHGRHPEKDDEFLLEHECSFVMYILKGKGRVYAGKQHFSVVAEDVVFVPKDTPFAVDGDFEYVTFSIPAFFLEQSEIVKVDQRLSK